MANLFVDDEREAPLNWMWAKTNAGAIAMLQATRIAHLSLDYSLKGETTDVIMEWLRIHPERWPTGSVTAHSSSSSACHLLERMIRDYAPTAG